MSLAFQLAQILLFYALFILLERVIEGKSIDLMKGELGVAFVRGLLIEGLHVWIHNHHVWLVAQVRKLMDLILPTAEVVLRRSLAKYLVQG